MFSCMSTLARLLKFIMRCLHQVENRSSILGFGILGVENLKIALNWPLVHIKWKPDGCSAQVPSEVPLSGSAHGDMRMCMAVSSLETRLMQATMCSCQ